VKSGGAVISDAGPFVIDKWQALCFDGVFSNILEYSYLILYLLEICNINYIIVT